MKKKVLISVAAAAMCLLPGGCSRNPVTGESELILISREQEIAMGEQAAPEFEKEFGGPVPDAQVQAYVRAVGQKVAAVSDRPMPYGFTVLRSDVPNAFALPGGKVYITSGLMRAMDSERQLAGVLSHEVTHVAARHNVKQLQKQLGVSVVAQLAGAVVGGDTGKAAEAATEIAGSMVLLRYSRSDEYQADRYGIQYMAKAGYNPWGMVEMLTKLSDLSKSEPGTMGEMFQTHPLTSKRIDEARERVQDRHSDFSPAAPDPNRQAYLAIRGRLGPPIGR